ncbi:hematopoietic cell signal transducer isoform 2-T2 [Thomomys bottae]
MACPDYLLLLFLLPGSCSMCGSLSLPLLAGLLVADAVVSLVMVGVVFACARSHGRRSPQGEGDGKLYINMPGRRIKH